MRTFVIVGGGLAGAAAAHTLRAEAFDGRIILVGKEERFPYERPPLSKEYLRGDQAGQDTTFLAPGWYSENGVEVLLGERAVRLDLAARRIELSGGTPLDFDALLLATGGVNRVLPVAGWTLDGVIGLRTVEDADRIRDLATPGSHAVIVGAGFIGCEVAASLRYLGVEVDVVEFFELPLIRVVGPEVARVYAELHAEHGVGLHMRQGAERFEGDDRVRAVLTTDGARLPCDFVVTGVGIAPVTELAQGTAIEVSNGVLVDERCRTSVPGVFAAGDVANHLHPVFGRLRVEHYDNALKMGAAAARSMLDHPEPYDDLHWFWSDQYDTNLQYIGAAPEGAEFVARGSLEGRSFTGFYLHEGLVRAVVGMDRGREVRRAAALIRSRARVDPRALADDDVEMKELVARARRASGEQSEGSVTA